MGGYGRGGYGEGGYGDDLSLDDPFDVLLIETCSVLAKGNGSVDGYGYESQNFSTLATNVPCRVSTDAPGRAHEHKFEKRVATNFRRVFMRPPVLSGGVDLNRHHWLQIDGVNYDIFDILNPGGMNHHLEVIIEDVRP